MNEHEDINEVYYSIYNMKSSESFNYECIAEGRNREEKKEYIAKRVFTNLLEQIMKK